MRSFKLHRYFLCDSSIPLKSIEYDQATIDHIRFNIINISPDERSDEENNALFLANIITNYKRFVAVDPKNMRKGDRLHRAPRNVWNYVVTESYLLLFGYNTKTNLNAFMLTKNSPLGIYVSSKLLLDMKVDLLDVELFERIKQEIIIDPLNNQETIIYKYTLR